MPFPSGLKGLNFNFRFTEVGFNMDVTKSRSAENYNHRGYMHATDIYIYIYIYICIHKSSYYNSPFLSLAGARVARQLSFNVDNGLGIGEETALSLSCIINSGKNPPW